MTAASCSFHTACSMLHMKHAGGGSAAGRASFVLETDLHHSWTALISQYTKCGQGRKALGLYDDMRKAGVEPSPHTFIALLKACASLRDLKTAKRIHAELVRCGFESDLYVGSVLVDVYAKCRSLVDARDVFEKMPRRNVVSWTAIIFGYAQVDQGEEALQLYARMQQEGVVPNDRTYVSALKACSSMVESGERGESFSKIVTERCLKTVRRIHTDIAKRNLDSVFLATMLVDVYAKCGSLEDARQVFEKTSDRTVASWNAMIFGYAQMDRGEEALQLYTRMQKEGVVPDSRTHLSALKACSKWAESEDKKECEGIAVKERCLQTVRAIHADVVKGKFESGLFVENMLVDAYAKCGSLEDARHVFDKMPNRTVVSWTAMMVGYTQMEKGEESLQLFTRMQQEGVLPDGRAYVCVLKACSSLAELGARNEGDAVERCLETVRAIHTDIVMRNFESDVFVQTMLVDVYAKCGSLDDARHVFEKMPYRDVVSWTAMILGYAQMEKGEEALELYARMQQEGVVPDGRTYVGALNACGSVAGLDKGREIHAQILTAGMESIDVFVADSLIDMYGKCGSMVDAEQVFEALPRKETVAWNALITGYAHQGECELACTLFQRMKQEGVVPNSITFLGVLTACCHAGLVEMAQKYFESMSKDYGITPTIKHFTCMIDLLGRAGHLDKATDMIKTMPLQPNSDVWRCMLNACRKWGDVEVGREAFECAVRLNKDDAAAYVLMSNIYVAVHMQEEAKEMQAMRLKSQAWKQPGHSRWMDMSGTVHEFVVGDGRHPQCQNIYAKLGDLLVKMKQDGYAPHFESVLQCELEDSLSGHSEKLAAACSLLKTPDVQQFYIC